MFFCLNLRHDFKQHHVDGSDVVTIDLTGQLQRHTRGVCVCEETEKCIYGKGVAALVYTEASQDGHKVILPS